jgi:O-antigen/teichoic acid export membrane protein
MSASLDIFFLTFLQIKNNSCLSILGTILQILLISYFLWAGFGLFGAVISLIILNMLLLISKSVIILSQIRLSFPSFSLIKNYLAYSGPLIPGILGWWINTWGDRFVIGYFLGITSVGIYSASYNLGNIVYIFYAPISIIILPTITDLYNNNRFQEIGSYLNYLLKGYLMVAIPSAFGLAILSKSLLIALTTSEFLAGAIIVPIIAVSTILYQCSLLHSNILFIFKKTRTVGLISIVTASINIILNIILVPLIGIIGAAIATLVAFALHLILNVTFGFRMMKYNIDFKFILKSIIASVIMAFVIWKSNPLSIVDFLILIGIAILVYFGAMLLLRAFTKEEFVFFGKIVKR